MKKYTILIILLVTTIFLSCSSSQQKDEFKLSFSKVLSNKKIKKSRIKMDNHPTYEVYFTLEKDTNCIGVEINTNFKRDEFTNKMVKIRTFFVVEKKMGLDKFAQRQKEVYTTLGKNYTDTWRRKQRIVICTNKLDPLKQLTGKSIYRIRFTTFKEASYGFTVAIQLKANVKILYL